MRLTRSYQQSTSLAIDGDEAFEQLYHRLAAWCNDALAVWDNRAERARILERALTLLGLMDRLVDVSQDYEIASRILSLNRFVIKGVIEAKAGDDRSVLEALPAPLLALAEIFALIRAGRNGQPQSA